jgi:drug/metabolite transporter (DMT)-like permease
MQTLTRQQLTALVLLTLVWGLNWPIMKLGVTGFPPLSFRTLSIWIGLPVLGLARLRLPRWPGSHWRATCPP